MTPRLFGTAGIRGVTNTGITAELALRVARAYGDWISKNVKKHGSVAVGHDTRWGAEMLARAAASGFASAGLHAQFYGCVSTGVFSLNVARTKQDGGMLTRDYFRIEDEEGRRFWIFRDGLYDSELVNEEGKSEPAHWYVHGLFA